MKIIPDSFEFNDRFSGKLAIFCSDERFIEASLAFLKNSLKIQTGDLMVLPGGPAFIINDEPDLMERLRILIESHKIKQVVFISHSDCSYYKKKLKDLSEKGILEKQIEDNQKAINRLGKMFKDISVQVFHAQITKSKTIDFIQIN